jgi:hypothetical protein
MTSRNDKMSAGNSCPANMRVYRKRKRLEEANGSDVPKRTKLNAERQHEYRETYKCDWGTLVPRVNVENIYVMRSKSSRNLNFAREWL